ncbi:unnamed protein product [Linum trigynum]|uniref:RxLR effector protein n=1 Tax=Linum trigynum TaxID=586398 RepID=A0AAV2CEE5_9ROSI
MGLKGCSIDGRLLLVAVILLALASQQVAVAVAASKQLGIGTTPRTKSMHNQTYAGHDEEQLKTVKVVGRTLLTLGKRDDPHNGGYFAETPTDA